MFPQSYFWYKCFFGVFFNNTKEVYSSTPSSWMIPKAGETVATPSPKAEPQQGRTGGGGKGESYYRILSAYTFMHVIGFNPHSLKENGTQREWHY